MTRLLAFLVTLQFCISGGIVAQSSYPTREEVLARVYVGATITAKQVFLTAAEIQRIGKLSNTDVDSALLASYLAEKDDVLIGRAYVDTHVIRTKKESLLVCLDQEGRILWIEITAFREPQEYQLPEAWFKQYEDGSLNDELRLHRDIRPVAGATLSSIAGSDAVRRVLATDQVLRERTRP